MSTEPGRHSLGEPEPAGSDPTGSDAAELGQAELGQAEPDHTQPISTDAVNAGPAPADQDHTGPDQIGPDHAEPDSAERHMSSPPRRGAHRKSATAGPAAGSAAGSAGDDAPDGQTDQRRGGVGRTIVRGVGQTLITLGVVVLLFVVYEVYVTDLFGQQKQAAATEQLDQAWAQETAVSTAVSTVVQTAQPTVVVDPSAQVADPAQRTRSYDTTIGEGFAKLYVPAFGPDYVFTIIEGVEPDDLYIGPGHYPDTQYPGEQGNFAVAGHRVSKGSPFNDLGLLASCDAIVVETKDDWFVYRVLPMAEEEATWATTEHQHCDGVEVQTGDYAGVYGRFITQPTDYNVVRPVPGQGTDQVPADAERLITLTTCHPQFSDAERMIVHGTLVRTYAKADGFLPPELGEG